MKPLRRLLEKPSAKVAATAVTGILVAIAAYVVYAYSQGDTPETAHHTMFICTETGKTFRHKNQPGDVQPIRSPYSGRNTGVPAEPCYWARDGSTKSEPTWVLLNDLAGKPGPTFCPDCGRLVVGHNPAPTGGRKPPPTQQEYTPRGRPKGTTGPSRDEDR